METFTFQLELQACQKSLKNFLFVIYYVFFLFLKKSSIKVHHVLCIGNAGSKETVDWLKGIGEEFTMVRGDEDEVDSYLIFY